MADTNDALRALIRLIPPTRALKEDLEKSIHMELYAGTGDLAVQSLRGLQASVANITTDPYVAALAINPAANATDKEKVSLALLAAGQLAAYLEGQTGLVGMGGNSGGIQTAPNINIGPISGISTQAADKMVGVIERAVGGKEADAATP